MKRYLYILLGLMSLLLAGVGSSSGAAQGVQVFSCSEAQFHCSVSFDRILSNLDQEITETGQLAVSRNVLVCIPVGGSAYLISAEGSNPRPCRRAGLLDSTLSISRAPLVEISRPFLVRGRRIVSVRVSPLVGDAVFEKVEIKIGFNRTAAAQRSGEPEIGLFDRIFQSTLANYDQALTWVEPRKIPAAPGVLATNTLQLASRWYKIPVTRTGLHRITGSQFAAAGISLSGLESDSIRLFSAGGLVLPEDNDSARPVLQEVALYVEDGGDGWFEAGDEFLFFGESVNRWVHRANQMPEYRHNPYTTQNVYWLAVSGDFVGPAQRMAEVAAVPSGTADTTITEFTRPVHTEQMNLLSRSADGHTKDYYNWFWTDTTFVRLFISTTGAIPGRQAEVRLAGNTNTGTGGASYMDVWINGSPGTSKSCNSRLCTFETTQLTDGLTQLDISLGPVSSETPPYFDHAEVSYQSYLRPESGILDITLGSFDGRALVEVQDNFSADPLILDLADPLSPVNLTGYDRTAGVLSFETVLEPSGPNRFYCVTIQQAITPGSISEIMVEDLRSTTERADLILITDDALAGYLDDYINYREAQGYIVRLAEVDDIMDNFAFGLYDPTAIRDFLKFAYENYSAPAPSAVLFVGDGSYDFLDHLGTGGVYHVPPYIRQSDSACSDDAYVHFGSIGILDHDTSYINVPDRGLDMMTARWPVTDGNQIHTVTQKVIQYESSTDYGFWRNRIVLVADDQYTSGSDDELFHGTQTEDLEKNHIPQGFERKKIYLWEYPFEGRSKPAVNDDIVTSLNDGALIINYVGHGNPDVWAHEHVFVRHDDLPRLTNSGRLPLVFAASCAISFYDDPLREGMGEALLAMANGGAIAVIAATRLVYSSSNAAFNRKVFDVLLNGDSLSMCEAMYAAKLLRQYPGIIRQINDQKYIFFGDPLVGLSRPELSVEFTQAPDSITALGQERVVGRIIDSTGQTVAADGRLLVKVVDSDRNKLFQLIDGGNVVGEVSYKVTGPSIYRGSATIAAGNFDFEFMVPLDVGYGGTGAKVAVYALFDTVDGLGQLDSIVVRDSIADVNDSVGPIIDYGVLGRAGFASGDLVTSDDVLELTLEDPAGINLADHLGHGISLEIDDQVDNRANLTSLFEYDQDNINRGSLQYPLRTVSEGFHQFEIMAWDNANNVSVAQFAVEVASSTEPAITDLLNHPNPMADSTTFYFSLTQPADEFSLEIFTLSGKKIRVLSAYNLPRGTYPGGGSSLVWDGRDADGDRVATGVYIYKASASPSAGGDRLEEFGKVVVIN
ncbi:MAG: type IX secretion system sortase PorU [Candidatus Zixiibacteriota bacterium]|nr:MAG: type IX secretion system sortase PorU [candidate division Zixibacteria bacterium]